MRLIALLAPLLLLAGCAGMPSRADLPKGATPHTVYVVQYGWHTALLFDGKDMLARSSKLAQDFHDHKYMLIGWGDGAYFVEDHPDVSQAVKALVASDYPALQAGGRETNPPLGVAPGDSVPLAVTERGYNQLVAYIDHSIAADADGKPVYLGKQLPNLNLFYKATGNYSLLNNCNSWVVGALRAAELPVSGFNLTARSVFEQAKRISELQRE
jgi:uncharacterized protein (TIGR02117 family)